MRTLPLAWLSLLLLLVGCGTPTAAPCPEGRVLTDGFCTRLVCETGQRVVDGACVSISCPDGSTLEGEQCVFGDTEAPSTTAMPAGATYGGSVTVHVVATEPAVIFYSTDGSTPDQTSTSGPSPLSVTIDATAELRFFAVDAAGNEEGVNVESYVIDATGPDDVTNMQVTLGPPDASLTWTNPADLTGVLLVRGRAAPFGWLPENGKAYTPGDLVAPGVKVLAASDLSSFSDPLPWGDISTYAAWAYDDVLNYSAMPATAMTEIPVPHQTMALSVDLSSGTFDFQQPPDLNVTLGVEVSAALDALTLTVGYENLTPSPMYSMKAVVDNISAGVLAGAVDYDGDDAVYFGPNAIPPAASSTGTLRITGIPGGTNSVTMDISLVTHPLVITPGDRFGNGAPLQDSSHGDFVGSARDALPGYGLGQNGDRKAIRSGALSQDGLALFVTEHNSTAVTRIDLVTLEAAMSSGALGGTGANPTGHARLAMSPDGQFIYVAVVDQVHGGRMVSGCNQRPVPTDCDLTSVAAVKLNANDLTEVGRATIQSNIDNTTFPSARVGIPSVSPDGSRLAVTVDGLERVVFIDTSNMNILWNVPSRYPQPRTSAITSDNAFVFVLNKNDDLTRVNTANQVETDVVGATPDANTDGGNMIWGPDGNLYIALYRTSGGPGIVRVDPGTLAVDSVAVNRRFAGIGFQKDILFGMDNGTQLRLFTTGPVMGQLGLRDLADNPRGHFSLVTSKPLWNPN